MEKYDFGNRLYEYRTQKGLTQKELGKLLGVTDKAVSKWETGESKPRLDKMNKITELFDTSIDGLLGREQTYNSGENLKPYKTIFDLNLEKKNKHCKATRITTYIVGVLFIIGYVINMLTSFASGGITTVDYMKVFEMLIIVTVTFALMTYFKIKFDENPERNIKIIVIVNFLLFTVVSILSSINYCLIYRFVEDADYFEPIILGFEWVVALISFIVTIKMKKGYKIFASILSFMAFYSLMWLAFGFFSMPIMLGILTILLAEKYNFIKLADKAEIDYKVENKKHTKLVKVLMVMISIALVIEILFSWLSPYIVYRYCLHIALPNGYNVKKLYYDYDASFDKDECYTDSCASIKYDIPNEFVKQESTDDENFVTYKHENLGVISCSFLSEEESAFSFTEEDLEEYDDLEETMAKLKYLNYTYKRLFGVEMDSSYGMEYLMNMIDVTDVKFYETEKAMAMIPLLIMNSVSPTSDTEKLVMEFDDGEKCGLVYEIDLILPSEDNVKIIKNYKATVWKSNDKDGAYYQINYICRDANDDSIYTLCKIINSMEF